MAGNAHGLHSPFVYDLYTRIINDEMPFYSFDKVESIRSRMLLAAEKIEVEDFGTGKSRGEVKKVLPVSIIAKNSVKPKKYGQLLFRLVNYFNPQNILEIGTSLGISTMYLAFPSGKSKVITLEGSPNVAGIAEANFNKANVNNIEVIIGEFSKTLPVALDKLPTLDFVYFDGNHRKKPTLSYFEQCLRRYHPDSVFVFDDIYWSRGMAEAWEEIKKHEAVSITIDLYSFGLVFFRKGIPKQDFTLRF